MGRLFFPYCSPFCFDMFLFTSVLFLLSLAPLLLLPIKAVGREFGRQVSLHVCEDICCYSMFTCKFCFIKPNVVYCVCMYVYLCVRLSTKYLKKYPTNQLTFWWESSPGQREEVIQF